MPIPTCFRILLATLLLPCAQAFAICTPFPVHIRVGADPVHCQANDIQSAINMAGVCPVTIDITREHTYTNQHLTISDKYITFQAWGDGVTCADVSDTPPASNVPLVTIDGSGNGRVLTITGNSNVGLHNLTVTGGQTSDDASGGGISFDGQGSLYLINSTINLNHGGFGGGINVNGSSGPTKLYLMDHTQILVNTAAVSGGGIRIEGNTRLYAVRPFTLIGFNHAPNGYGGGLEVLGPARADIGSPGYNGLGVIYNNDAQYGGGIDILTFNDQADAIVRLFTTDPGNPVQLSGNFASHTGGAVYLRPFYSVSGNAASVLCAYDFRINGNAAQEGAAIYSDADHALSSPLGGTIALNTNPLLIPSSAVQHICMQTEAPGVLGAVACAPGIPCNELVDNKAEDQNAQPTAGATILLESRSDLQGDRFSARQNTGAHVLRSIGDDTTLTSLSNCLLTDNTLTAELIALTDGDQAHLYVNSCTVAGNTIGAPYAFLAPGLFTLWNSIIDQPGRATVDPAITDGISAGHVLTNDRSTLPDTAYIQLGAPSFVDAAHGNYHLLHSSLGVDDAPVDPSVPVLDLDGRTRVVDLPDIANEFGPMDLGAYEIQLACAGNDTIFCDGFDG
ncbi:MAG: hypothetical protein ABIW82_15920 [Dokdonella sp.]